MNYFLQGILKDTKWWINLILMVLFILSLAEIISLALMPKPIFNGWAMGITLIAVITYFSYHFKKAYIRDKKLREIKKYLPVFEKKRTEDLLEYLKEHPTFQTFCYKCKYFDTKHSACSLHLFKRNKFIKINPTSEITHCLYWNAKIPPKIIEDVI